MPSVPGEIIDRMIEEMEEGGVSKIVVAFPQMPPKIRESLCDWVNFDSKLRRYYARASDSYSLGKNMREGPITIFELLRRTTKN